MTDDELWDQAMAIAESLDLPDDTVVEDPPQRKKTWFPGVSFPE